jgi:hypothetical protein
MDLGKARYSRRRRKLVLMRHSGEQFKAAFSCFVYSTADPKGVDCIDKFKTMQECFQQVCLPTLFRSGGSRPHGIC